MGKFEIAGRQILGGAGIGMQQKILVPLDGSKVGEAAIPFVEKLISMMSPEVKVEVNLLGVVTGLRHWVVVGEASVPGLLYRRRIEVYQERGSG